MRQVLDDSRKWWKARNRRGVTAHVPHTIVAAAFSPPASPDATRSAVYPNPIYTHSHYQVCTGILFIRPKMNDELFHVTVVRSFSRTAVDAAPAAAAPTVRPVGRGERVRGAPTPTGCAASASARRESSDTSSDSAVFISFRLPAKQHSDRSLSLPAVEGESPTGNEPALALCDLRVASTKVLTNRAACRLPGVVSHNLIRTLP